MRQIRCLLLVTLLLGVAVRLSAQSDGFGGGTGAAADPYIIESVSHLNHLRAKVAGGETFDGQFFRQKADIDLTSERWVPIGTVDKPFKGVYSGGMQTIKGLTLDLAHAEVKNLTHVGLFGNAARVLDLHLLGPTAKGTSQALEVFGFVAAELSNDLESVVVEGAKGSITLGLQKGNLSVGALCGKSANSSRWLHFDGALNVTLKAKQLEADVEVTVAPMMKVENCVVAGEVTVTLAREGSEKLAHNLTLNYYGIANASNSLLYSKLNLKDKEKVEKTFADGKALTLNMMAFGASSSDSYFDKTVLGGTLEPTGMGVETAKLQEGKPSDLNNLSEAHFVFAAGSYPQLDIARYRESAVKLIRHRDNPTKENPYRVSTGDDLIYAKRSVFPSFLLQVKDIELPSFDDNLVKSFSGIYNGDGHTIRGAKMMYNEGDMGLFGSLNGATISNLTLEGFELTHITDEAKPHSLGVLAATSEGVTSIINVRIKNASVLCKVAGQDVFVGGIVGQNKDQLLTVRRVLIDGMKVDLKDANSFMVGGLVGQTLANKVELTGCEVRGIDFTLPSITGVSTVGGLVGRVAGATGAPTIIHQCLAEGNVASAKQNTADMVYAGGLVGRLEEDTRIEQCAGRVGINIAGEAKAVGGLVGELSMVKDHLISNSYVFLPDEQGIICAKGKAAGVIGFLQDGGATGPDSRKIKNCWVSAAVNKTWNTAKAFAVYSDPGNCAQYIDNCVLDFTRSKLREEDYQNQHATETNFFDVASAYTGFEFKDPIVWEMYTFGDLKRARLFWETTTAWHPLRGDGSQDTPYEIATVDNLRWLMYQESLFGQKLHFRQVADIDATPSREWTLGEDKAMVGTKEYAKGFKPLGTPAKPWTNSYDGAGYTISNLWIVRPDEENVGMFGYVSTTEDGTIENVTLKSLTVMGKEDVGGLIGEIDAEYFTISACRVLLDSIVATEGYLGGLVGYAANFNRMAKCSAMPAGEDAMIRIPKPGGSNSRVGGLIGAADANTSKIEECMAMVTVSVPANTPGVGGFIGYNEAEIDNCYARGTIRVYGAVDANTGGFVGDQHDKSIRNAYAVVPIIDLTDKEKPKHVLDKAFAGALTGGKLEKTYFQSPLEGNTVKNASEEEKAKCAPLTEERFKSGVVPDGFGAVWNAVNGTYPRLSNTEGQRIRFAQPANGKIEVTSGGVSVANDAFVPVGAELTITLTPDPNYEIDKLTANGVELTVTNNAATYTVPAVTVTIVATFKAKIDPTPEDVKVTGLALNPTTTKIKVGQTATLQLVFTPSNATNKNVTWSSANEAIAKVSGGTVTAVAVGTTTIKAVSQDGNYPAECTVEVEAGEPSSVESHLLAGLTVSPNPFTARLEVRGAESVLRYELVSAAGVVVASGRHAGQEALVIETSHLPSGLYLLRLVAADGQRVERMLRR